MSVGAQRRLIWDPRTKLFTLLIVNALVLGSGGGLPTLVAGAVLTGLLLAGQTRGTVLWAYAAAFAGFTAGYVLLPAVSRGMLAATVVAICYWMARFCVTFGLFCFLFLSTRVGELAAALAAWRLPRAVVVPFAVMLRFIPTAIEELRSILDAMRLRGILVGTGGVLTSPVRTAEYVLLPLLASATRIADDLSASALTRGLGRTSRPTSIVRLGFGPADAVLVVAVCGLVVLRSSGFGMGL